MENPYNYRGWDIVNDVHVMVPVAGKGAMTVVIPWMAAKDHEALAILGTYVGRIATDHFFQHVPELMQGEPEVDKFEPPLTRFLCESCQNTWDAWVEEDGSLEDPRDRNCSDENCPAFGEPAKIHAE